MSRGHFVLKPRRDELARKDESAAEHCPTTEDGSIGLYPTLCSSSGPTAALPAARTEQDSRPEMGAAPVFARNATDNFTLATADAEFPAVRARQGCADAGRDARAMRKAGVGVSPA
jgi:hypothetical protein